jgi:hypothetical protein
MIFIAIIYWSVLEYDYRHHPNLIIYRLRHA